MLRAFICFTIFLLVTATEEERLVVEVTWVTLVASSFILFMALDCSEISLCIKFFIGLRTIITVFFIIKDY